MIKLIQISDCHLLQDETALFCDVHPDQHLKHVLNLAKNQNPDVLLLTGDLSQDGSEESYQRLAEFLKPFTCPIYFIPGNHDDAEVCHRTLAVRNIQQKTIVDLGHWQLIFLDSVVPQETAGHLKQDQLDLLAVHVSNGKDTIVCMHHHPVNVSGFMDKYIVNNYRVFQEFIIDKSNIKVVIFGHVHSDFHEKIHHVDFYGCPSTSVQFSLGESTVPKGLDVLPPGLRVLELFEGGFETSVMRALKSS